MTAEGFRQGACRPEWLRVDAGQEKRTAHAWRAVAASALEGSSAPRPSKKASHSFRADLLQEPEKKTDTTPLDVGKRLLAGGIAGAIAKTAIAPLDRVKIIFQTHPTKPFSLRNVVLELVATPCSPPPRSPAYLAAPLQAASLTPLLVYPRVRLVQPLGDTGSHAEQEWERSVRGAPGETGSLTYCECPTHAPLFHAQQVGIYSREGFLGLWRGNAATVLRVFPYAGIQFAAFDVYKRLLGKGSSLQKLLAGSAAGATAVILTYPLDLIRARLAVRMSEGRLNRAAWNDAITGGSGRVSIKELYRGLNPTLIGILPYAGIAFFIRDFLNQVAANQYQVAPVA